MGFFDDPIPVPEQFEDWFDKPYLFAHPEVSGVECRAEGLTLGMRSGPACNADALCHEMAHLIEAEDHRVCKHAWGMKYAQIEVQGRMYDCPVTPQGTYREIRVWGIQRVLNRMMGVPWGTDTGSLVWYQGDFVPFLVSLGLLCEDDDDVGLDLDARNRLAYDIADRMVDYEELKWTPQRVRAEWDRKAELVRQAYESGTVQVRRSRGRS